MFNQTGSCNGARKNCHGVVKITPRAARNLKHASRKNPFLSSNELLHEHVTSGGIAVSAKTIRNCLKSMKLKSFVAKQKPYVTGFQRSRRVKWAKSYLSKPLAFWKAVIFTDETHISLFNGGKRARVYRAPGEAYLPQHLLPSVKHSLSVHLWGSVSYRGVGKIHFLEQGGRMNSHWYSCILQKELKETVIEQFGNIKNATVQDDGAPCHRSKVVMNKFSKLGFKHMEWVGQSPDCNPIENLWMVLKNKVRAHSPRTLAELKTTITNVWNNEITLQYCKSLVCSMPRRLKSVIQNRGFPTKY
jgi:hypothetical protein